MDRPVTTTPDSDTDRGIRPHRQDKDTEQVVVQRARETNMRDDTHGGHTERTGL